MPLTPELHRIRVNSQQPYDVCIAPDLRSLTPPLLEAIEGTGKVLIIHQPALASRAQELTQILGDANVEAYSHELRDAEQGKTIAEATRCWDRCAEIGLSRRDTILGLGGGAATDVAGFIAATWMRGISVIQVPTTLLAMVDAAVGGKTGINTAAGKNLVGAFHEPDVVLVDLSVLRTLPAEEIVAGSAEIIKAGFIADTAILDLYEQSPAAAIDPDGTLPELIRRAITVKATVVAQDLKESSLREILNYGHTYGHAVERHEKFRWPHGHAVAVGMVFEAELAKAAGKLGSGVLKRHRNILTSVGLPTSYRGADLDTLIDAMALDKKNKGAGIRFVIVTEEGKPERLENPSRDLLEQAYTATVGGTGQAKEDDSQ